MKDNYTIILNEFFGGLIYIKVSERKSRMSNKIRRQYYIVNIDVTKYVNILLCNTMDMPKIYIDIIQKRYKNNNS